MKYSSTFSSSPCLLFIFLMIFFNSATATRFNIPRLSPIGGTILQELSGIVLQSHHSEHYKTFYYKQALDHFNYRPESYSTFQQRYVINFKYWGGANASAPILAYLGSEGPLDGDIAAIGFLTDNAVRFNALLVYIEHRYYGKSIPFGSREEALKNASTLGYFNSAQAIADYAEILIHVKKQYHAEDSPVIVVGASYGGMLASWFRLKYPHVALGALASSAPILYFDDITPQDGYFSIVTKDFREASETCYQTIRDSWSEIDKVASQHDGLSTLSMKFKTCIPLETTSELKDYLKNDMYAYAAQYNQPPTYPVTVVCGGIDGEAFGSDILSKIFAGVVAYQGNRSCYVNAPTNLSETTVGWRWQDTLSRSRLDRGRLLVLILLGVVAPDRIKVVEENQVFEARIYEDNNSISHLWLENHLGLRRKGGGENSKLSTSSVTATSIGIENEERESDTFEHGENGKFGLPLDSRKAEDMCFIKSGNGRYREVVPTHNRFKGQGKAKALIPRRRFLPNIIGYGYINLEKRKVGSNGNDSSDESWTSSDHGFVRGESSEKGNVRSAIGVDHSTVELRPGQLSVYLGPIQKHIEAHVSIQESPTEVNLLGWGNDKERDKASSKGQKGETKPKTSKDLSSFQTERSEEGEIINSQLSDIEI
ncbi:hypothetical protein LWI28_015410 [Acer negundo]|uniref:Lysosomal Pro-X carboxypeptidase n=1 Tax=Acer negundo TaxID=4023 RepID=A0AAD5P230_ACENE|nr:hypothetical protein LWI28_015410 [Acer negundo]